MPFEERPQPGQERFDFLFRYDGHDHFETFLLAEHEVCFVNAVVTFPGHIADNGVAGCLDTIEQIGHKRLVVSRDDYTNFLHRMQCQTHQRTPFRPMTQ